MSVVRRVTGVERWEEYEVARRDELRLYLALSRFDDATNAKSRRRRIGRPKLSDLPESLQLDIRAHFSTYAAACEEGDQTLFSAGRRAEPARGLSPQRRSGRRYRERSMSTLIISTGSPCRCGSRRDVLAASSAATTTQTS